MELPGLAIAALTGEPHEPDTPIRAMSSGAGEGLPEWLAEGGVWCRMCHISLTSTAVEVTG